MFIEQTEEEYRAAQDALISQISSWEETLLQEQEEQVSLEEEGETQEEEQVAEEQTTPPVVDEDAIRKQIEKEMKKKYISQVSIKDKEAKRLQEELNILKQWFSDDGWLDVVDKLIEAKIAQKEIKQLEEIEKKSFLNEYKEANAFLNEIEEIKADFPNMSWERAYQNWKLDNPERAGSKKSNNTPLSGTVPSSVSSVKATDAMSNDELRAAAMKELLGM